MILCKEDSDYNKNGLYGSNGGKTSLKAAAVTQARDELRPGLGGGNG